MTSQGQRFRRRALRRGYKVDEVDAFLDRVEATLAGEQVGPPVGAQEVHDVVFRVRFGGYDEWQVDLHLDRVERQLAEFEERGGRPVDPMRDSMRGGLSAERSGAIDRGSIERSGPPALPGGPGGPGGGMSRNGMAGAGMGGGPQFGGPQQPQQQFGNQGQQQFGGPGQQQFGGPPMSNPGMAQTERIPAPIRDDRMMPPQAPQMPQRQQMPQPDPYAGRYDEPTTYGGQPQQPPQPQLPQRNAPQGYDQGGYDEPTTFGGFEPGRHGRSDMTAEIRMPERDPYGAPQMPGPMQQPPAGMPGSPMGPPGGAYGQPQPPQQSHLGPPIGEPGGELYRVDQLRRTFQPRRFGSGYDPMQVDRLFEGILQAMTGRGPMPVNENDLDMLQFGLVPNGYFEAEVDAALREVKDILLRGGRR
ncbi:DivIVA domain-containing protein [Actinoplanes oblitus]|uniref:DivIVA domain-containing protein n=1 Tax=Actinoplanes oblitus TaxID=3040509 RepID=A0ABY8WDH2_9ACTN|nr:DivIVA domain-containing protein [Actinoplanes oblitus]WIM95432.1 DivIVA domain-containing protein [Actinoplanes oblitus]